MSNLGRKLLSLVLAVVMFSWAPAVITGNAAEGDDTYDAYPVASQIDLGTMLSNPAMTIWGGYAFVVHSTGLKVLDLQTETMVADWTLNNTVIPGLTRFTPNQVFVDDRYIIVTASGSGSQSGVIVILENNKRFDNTPPKLIRRLGNTTIMDVKKVHVDNENLYIINTNADGLLEGWKLALDRLESIATKGSAANKYIELSDSRSDYEYLCMTTAYDNVWNDIEINGNKAYIPVFNNNEVNAPFKTLMLLTLDLDEFTESSIITNIVAEGGLRAMKSRLLTSTITDAQIRRGWSVYAKDAPDVQVTLEVQSVLRSNLRIGIINITPEICMVTLYFTDIAAVADKLGITEEQLMRGEKVLAMTVDGQEYTFSYTEETAEILFYDGSFVLDGSNFYLLTNSSTNNAVEYAVYGTINQGVCKEIGSTSLFSETNNAYGFTGAVKAGGDILGFMRGVDNTIYGIDTTLMHDGTYIGTYQIRQYTGDSMADANVYSDLVEYNNSIYYISRSRSSITRLSAGTARESVNKVQNGNALPVVLYGTSPSDDAVSVTIDGQEYSVPVQNNMWRLTVASQTNGYHTAAIGQNEISYMVDTPAITEITNISAGESFGFDISSHAEEYGLNVQTLNIVVEKLKVGVPVDSLETEVQVGDRSSVSVPIDDTDADAYAIYVFAQGSELMPLAKYVYQNGMLHAEGEKDVIGDVSGLTITSVEPDNVNRKAKISGTVQSGGKRLVIARIGINQEQSFASTTSDAEGAFVLECAYIGDGVDIGSEYTVSVYAQLASQSADTSFYAVDMGDVEEALQEAKGAITDIASLRTYLAENPEFAEVIKVDLEQVEFAELSTENQNTVLGKVLALLQADNVRAIPETFETETHNLFVKQTEQEALAAVKAATTNTVTRVLREYKEVLGISDELWAEYENLASRKRTTANTSFLKKMKSISTLDGIADALEGAVEDAKKATNTTTDNSGSRSTDYGGASGNYFTSPTDPNPNDNSKPEQNPEKRFVDLDGYAWAEESINALAERNIVTGVGDNQFAPGNSVTREQFVTMLVNAAGLVAADGESSFSDVSRDDWFYPYVVAGEQAGLVAGSDGKFGAGQNISRQDMAVFVYRAGTILGVEFSGGEISYVDAADISDYAAEAVAAVSATGIMSGMGDGVFAPRGVCTRAMAARVIYGLLQLMQ